MGIKKALVIGILLEILLGGAAAAFYFLYYIKTPTYSFNAIQKAIQIGNADEFAARVDLDSLVKSAAADLASRSAAGSPDKKMLESEEFISLCKDDCMYYVANGKWQDVKEPTAATALQDKIGLKTTSFRKVEAIGRDYIDPEAEDQTPTATAVVRFYEPNYGDSFIVKFKLRQVEDESWQLYAVENYGEFVDELVKQNERDLKRYIDKVRNSLKKTEDDFAALRQQIPVINKDWILEARKIMKESNEALEDIPVPIAGTQLNNLLKERKGIFVDMMELYYENLTATENIEEEKKKAEELAKKPPTAKGKKVNPQRRVNAAEKKLEKLKGQLTDVNKKWSDNKADIAKIIGSTDETINRGVRAMRNNDDAAVRAANYPGADTAGDGEGVHPFRPESLPEVSALNP